MKKIIITLIGIITTIVLFLFVPISSIQTSILSNNAIAYDQPFPSIAHGFTLSQPFVAQYDYIDSLKIYIREMNCDTKQGYLLACILDDKQTTIYQNKLALSEITNFGWQTILSDLNLSSDKVYYLTLNTIDALDDGPTIAFYTDIHAASKEELNQTLTYATFPVENASLKLSFEYKVPISKFDSLCYYIFMVFIITFICSNLYECITKCQQTEPCT